MLLAVSVSFCVSNCTALHRSLIHTRTRSVVKLQSLIEQTWTAHCDHDTLVDAHAQMTAVAEYVNEVCVCLSVVCVCVCVRRERECV